MRKYVQMGQGGGVIHHPPPGAGVDRAQGKPRQKDSRCRPETGYMYPRSELPTSCHTRRTASEKVYSVSLLDSKKYFIHNRRKLRKRDNKHRGFTKQRTWGPKGEKQHQPIIHQQGSPIFSIHQPGRSSVHQWNCLGFASDPSRFLPTRQQNKTRLGSFWMLQTPGSSVRGARKDQSDESRTPYLIATKQN